MEQLSIDSKTAEILKLLKKLGIRMKLKWFYALPPWGCRDGTDVSLRQNGSRISLIW